MSIAEASWTIVHGDSSRSPVFAVCKHNGKSVDLESGTWVVRAQARTSIDALDIVYGWSIGHGIELSTGTVKLSNGRRVETSTVGLSLLPGDFSQLPREWSGITEIEIASDSSSSPAERYTIARLETRIRPDVTHDIGALIVSPGLPAPSAPAGGVLAGSYPNPVFAVPMATTSELNVAVNNSSIEDRKRSNHSGTQSADTLTDGATNRAYTAVERTKLQGVATGATANASDVELRDRATHTGSMLSTGISDFAEAVQDTMGGSFVEGTNISIAYNDANGTFTIAAGGSGGGGASGPISGVRTVNGNSNAFTNEILLVDCSGGPVTISPPPSAPNLTQVTVIKSDSSSNAATWNAATNGASNVVLSRRWDGATFIWNGSTWYQTSRTASLIPYFFSELSGLVPDSALSSAIARVTDVASASTIDRARANHTGTQPISTVSGLQNALDSKTTLVNPVGKSSAYTASPGEYVLAELVSGAWTLTLPANPIDKTRVGWKITTQAATPNVLTVACGGSDRFNTATGPTSATFVLLNQAAIAQYNSATSSWVIQSSDLALAQLDARYIASETNTAFRAHLATTQSLASASNVTISFPTVTRSSSLVTPSVLGTGNSFTLGRAGVWSGSVTVRVAAATSGECYLGLIKVVSGGNQVIGATGGAFGSLPATRHLAISEYFDLNDVIYVILFQNSGASVNIDHNSGQWCHFKIAWMHP